MSTTAVRATSNRVFAAQLVPNASLPTPIPRVTLLEPRRRWAARPPTAIAGVPLLEPTGRASRLVRIGQQA
jgi:hypothetical protein